MEQHFKHADFRAEAVEAGGKLDAHGAGAQDRQGLRDLAQVENLNIGEDTLVVGSQTREHARLRAGGHHDVAGFVGLFAGSRSDLDLAGAGQAAITLDPIHLVLLHQELDALGVLGDDLVLAVAHQREIETRVLAVDALFGGVQEPLPDVRGMQESLGGNAADVQTGAAQLGIFFDDGGLQAVLARANGRRVASRATAQDNHVICHFIFSLAGSLSVLTGTNWFREGN